MKKVLRQLCYATVTLLLTFACSKNEPITETEIAKEAIVDQSEPLSVQEINQLIDAEIESTGDFDWNQASDYVLWSALQHSEGVLTIGYGANENDFANKSSTSHESSKQGILTLVRNLEAAGKSKSAKEEDVLIYEDEYLTLIDVKATQRETIAQLRKDASIRYLEPSGYPYFQGGQTAKGSFSDSGCDFSGETVAASDYTTIQPNAKMPWNFPIHQIDAAWTYSQGAGVTIGVVDTGLSPNQSLLGSNFNNGYSASGRTLEKYGVYVDSFWPWSRKTDGVNDKCGHGTSMAAAAVGPRNTLGLPVGVAYKANLISYRASSDVLLNGYQEQRGTAKAISQLGARSDVKIISISMGYIFSINRIKDAIRYAYGRGKLIVCAGGTSTSVTSFVGVTFPGSMNETVAVTGVEEGQGYDECDACHKGSKIDFTMVMERANNNHVPVLGYYSGGEDYVGGSSVATAEVAGIAALVWSKNPSWTRTQVLNKLNSAGELYPNRNGSYGWGNLNALKAVQ